MATSRSVCRLLTKVKAWKNTDVSCAVVQFTHAQNWRSLATAVPATLKSQAVERWQLMSSVCLERLPIITQEMTPFEKEVSELYKKMDLEYSCLSDHELRHAEDLKLAERRKRDNLDDSELETSGRTAVESEDMWEEELREFKPASRITESDKKKDICSTDRELDRKLILIVKQNLGTSQHWVLPMGVRCDHESMRQAAERVLSSLCGVEMSTVFLGNAPCGYLKYKYPEAVRQREGFLGAKVFFFKAQFRTGQLKNSADVTDYAWISRDELSRFVSPMYCRKIKRFLL